MAQKKILTWVCFKGEDQSKPAPAQNALERIRDLENQLNDLRSRKDITGLSREEFEILATETAMSIIKSAQQREAKATSTASKIVGEALDDQVRQSRIVDRFVADLEKSN